MVVSILAMMDTVNAFLPILTSNILPAITSLESIVSTKAFISSIGLNLRNEITFERIIFQVVDFNFNNHNIYIFTTLFMLTLYGQWKYYDGLSVQTQLDKYRKIDKFSRMEKMTKELLFLLAFLLVKDVQSVV
jgi:hypothetical protein